MKLQEKRLKAQPMVEPTNFTKLPYTTTDAPDRQFTFAGLCEFYGLKYISVYKRVKYYGMTVHEAIANCIKDPHTWGETYWKPEEQKGVDAMHLGCYLSTLTLPKLEHTKSQLNLSEDEEKIFDMLAKRKSIYEISESLGMSTRTVDREIQRIKQKLT